MFLIILGILLILAGGGSAVYGVMENDDVEAQFTSFMESGQTDPGDIFILAGAFGVVLGIVLLILGIVLCSKKRAKKAAVPVMPVAPVAPAAPVVPVAPAAPVEEAPVAPAAETTPCTVCGNPLLINAKFCGNCGTPVNPYPEAETETSAVPEITQTVEDVMKEAAEPAPTAHCCPHFAGHNEDGSSKCQFCSKANPPVPATTCVVPKVEAPAPAPAPAPVAPKPVYHAAPKGDRKAICPKCGARQVEATHCKYCGTRMS